MEIKKESNVRKSEFTDLNQHIYKRAARKTKVIMSQATQTSRMNTVSFQNMNFLFKYDKKYVKIILIY